MAIMTAAIRMAFILCSRRICCNFWSVAPNSFDRRVYVIRDRCTLCTLRVRMVAMKLSLTWIAAMLATGTFGFGQSLPAEYEGGLKALGKQGDFKGNVLRVNIPRNDVKVTIDGSATPTPFGFGGWLAMTKGEGQHEVMMGDLVLLEDEVNPVMSALLDNGLEVTALHNHFFWDDPRIFFMHVHGRGTPADLARKLKPAIDLIGKGSSPAAVPSPAAPSAGPPAKM